LRYVQTFVLKKSNADIISKIAESGILGTKVKSRVVETLILKGLEFISRDPEAFFPDTPQGMVLLRTKEKRLILRYLLEPTTIDELDKIAEKGYSVTYSTNMLISYGLFSIERSNPGVTTIVDSVSVQSVGGSPEEARQVS
jgi:hypothetical protein